MLNAHSMRKCIKYPKQSIGIFEKVESVFKSPFGSHFFSSLCANMNLHKRPQFNCD